MKEFFCIKNQQPFLSRTQAAVLCLVAVFFVAIFFATPAIAHALVAEIINGIINATLGSIVWLLGKILAIIVSFLIQIASYNNIIYQPAVIKGWLVMRDILNVGFIIFMMMIAFGTIFNVQKYSYKSMLGKVLLAAILVNFSKTIVGLAIDFAHVFTMMFFNAYKSAAAGNMTEALGLREMIQFSNAVGGNSGEVLGAYLLAIVMLIVAIVTVLVYLLVFVTRIVILWFLTITSPVFFVMRAVPFGEKYASQWMTEFGKYVPMGPILAFFLWLSFAIMGTSHSTFDSITGATGDLSAGVSSVGSPVNMLSFVISIGVLWMALKYAGQTSGIAGKFAGTMMGKLQGAGGAVLKGGGRALKGTLKAPFKVAGGTLARAKWLQKGVDNVAGARGGWGQLAKFTGVRAVSERTGLAMSKNRAGYKKKATERVQALKSAKMQSTIARTASGKKITPMGRAKKEAAIAETYHTLEGSDAVKWAQDVSDPDDIKDSEQLRAMMQKLIDITETGSADEQGEALTGIKRLHEVAQRGTNLQKAAVNLDKDNHDIYQKDPTGKYLKDATGKYVKNSALKDEDVRAIETTQRRLENSKTFADSKASPTSGRFDMFRLDGEEKEKTEKVEKGVVGGNMGNVTIAAQNVIVQDQGKQRLEIGAQTFVQQMQEKDTISSQIDGAQQEADQAIQQQRDLLDRGEGGEALMQVQDDQRRAQDKLQGLQGRNNNINPALRIDKEKWGIAKNQDMLSRGDIAKFLPDLLKQSQEQGVVGPQLQAFEQYLKNAESIQIEDTRKPQDRIGGVDSVITQQQKGLETRNPKLYLDKDILHVAGMKDVAGATLHVQDATPQDQQTLEKLLNALDQKMASQGYSEAERALARQGLEKSGTVRIVNTDANLHQGERGGQEQYLTGLEEKMHSFVGKLPQDVLMQFWNALGDQKAGVQQKITEEYKGTYGAEPPEAIIADEFLSTSLVNATRYGKKDDATYQLNDAMKTMVEQSQDPSMRFMQSVLKSGTLSPPASAKQQSAFRARLDSEQVDQEIGSPSVSSSEAQTGSADVGDALRDVAEQVMQGAEQMSETVQATGAAALQQEKKEAQTTRRQASDRATRQSRVQVTTTRRTQEIMKDSQAKTQEGQGTILRQGAETAEQIGTVAENQTTQSTQPASSDTETSSTQEVPSAPETKESVPQSQDTSA